MKSEEEKQNKILNYFLFFKASHKYLKRHGKTLKRTGSLALVYSWGEH